MSVSEPLPPEGFTRLDEAFALLRNAALGNAPDLQEGYGQQRKAYAEQETKFAEEFLLQMNSSEFEILICSPDGEKFAIQNDTFERSKFPDLLFYHHAIPSGLGGPLANYVGGIIALQRREFTSWARRWVRDWLIEELRYGRVQLDDARTRAMGFGIESLEGNPDPHDFDPMQEAYWTLAMTAAWVSWRDLSKVIDQWNRFRNHCHYFWHEKWRIGFDGEIHEGWILKDRNQASLLGLMLDEAVQCNKSGINEHRQIFTIKAAREDMWEKLQNSEIAATGKQYLSQRKSIEGFRWQDLEIYGDGGKSEYVSPNSNFADYAKISDVTLKRLDVLALWEPRGATISKLDDVEKNNTPIKSDALIITSHRPAVQRQAAEAFLRTLSPKEQGAKIESLIARLSEAGTNVSKDTMRRARRKLAEG